ncbi:pirin family protein [Oscillospiraceae bacterium HV4-5-C5C]|nr:pirin family protein [Oscillospiraceae bacterium HV4-5-C5C]
MLQRSIQTWIRGRRAVDGAGVRMTRILTAETVRQFDPFLLLDSFDSTDPDDYLAGFPLHPHRGIETLTYLISGEIDHRDSLGNAGRIGDGEAQWMTAGSGIMHEEMPQESPRMLGFQLWINLPARDKMTRPVYHDLRAADIPLVSPQPGVDIRVIAGSLAGQQGYKPAFVAATVLDISLAGGTAYDLALPQQQKSFLFLISGSGQAAGQRFPEKSAILLGQEGEGISLNASDGPLRVIAFAGQPLQEPIAWGGPVVMNTQKQLSEAFDELNRGTFIKTRPEL